MTISEDQAMDLLRRFGKAFNRADVDGILACVTDDFVWVQAEGPDAPDGRVRRGRDEVRDALAERDATYRDVRFSETAVHFAGDRVIGTFRATGSHAADGAPYDVRGVDIYSFRDGRIASKDSYWKRII
ncbi:MAG: nuclear transport factor 2 family protein [Alphaproteobacteria bacterium]|jgi:ketosteroid isomerase-like protein|nr:nuclear transport factor 2 family protein [Alphaproteobacteria bacterium]MDP6811960.1 nuclear transport factor 2 family protein [Alphaproteobacteria bacterium]